MWTRKETLIVALSALAGVGTLGGALAAQAGPDVGAFMQIRGEGGGPGWGRHHGGGPGFVRLCDEERRTAWIEDHVQLIESFAEFTPEQTEAWTALKAAVGTASERVGETCAELEAEGRPASTPERLARAETFLGTGLSVVQEIRPAFDGFYATLDEDQRQALDRLARRHRR